ncbi:hypothetical protein [Celeribacter indicus]|nr:hypothetical protein [Celeribacter indicus]SDW04065.1 hypothetical protein SAMN05443573_101187 [Celeribacter indicus]
MRKFLFRLLAIIILLGVLGFVGFAYVGDLTPDRSERSVPVTIDVN